MNTDVEDSTGSGSKRKVRWIALGAVVIILFATLTPFSAIPWLAVSLITGKIDEWRYSSSAEFKAAKWKEKNPMYRYSVCDYVVSSLVRPGMQEQEVRLFLGDPDSISTEGNWLFAIKEPGFLAGGFNTTFLIIEFTAEKKVRVARKSVFHD